MTRVRMIALGALAAVVAVAPLSAQGHPDSARVARRGGVAGQRGMMGRPGRGQAMGQRLGRSLFRGIQLTEQEKASLKAIRAKYQPQFQSLREQLRPQMQAAMAARRSGDTAAAKAAWAKTAAQREQLKALAGQMRDESRLALTPEHRAQFDQNLAQVKDRMARAEEGGRGFRAGRGARAAQGFARLNLSDAEKAKVKDIRAKYQPQFQALRAQSKTDREKTREQAKALQDKVHAEIRAALTPEHQQQLDSLRARRGGKGPTQGR